MRAGLLAALAFATAAPAADRAPADRILAEWLAAINTTRAAPIKAFYVRHLADPDPVFAIESAQDSCGLTVDRIAARTATTMTVLLRQKCLPGLQRARLVFDTAGKLKSLDLKPLALSGDGATAAVVDIADRLAARDAFAGLLLILRGTTRLAARSWGTRDARDKAAPAIALDTPMFLASAGKMFTGVAILQLVDAGRIDLDAPLGRYLTDYPDKEMAKVTIRQLLTHRGGTGDIGILAREDGANRAKVRTIADMIALNGHRPPDFPPGSKADYSNYGFILLGAVIERVTGTSYHDHVAAHIFEPAGMTHAGFHDHDHLQAIPVGYTTFFGAEPRLVSNLDVLPWRGASAGGGVASANDLLRFFDALKAGRLLSPEMMKLATTPGATSWYGMGFVAQATPRPQWGHGGTSYGMDVAAHTWPTIGTTFICLATRDMACNRLITAWHFRKDGPGN